MYCVDSPSFKLGESFRGRYTQYINTVGSSQVSRLPGLLFRGALLYATEYHVYDRHRDVTLWDQSRRLSYVYVYALL